MYPPSQTQEKLMMKPQAAAIFTFSVLAASSSAAVFAETTITEGIWNEDKGQFEFYDSKLSNIDPSKPYFASMRMTNDYFYIAGHPGLADTGGAPNILVGSFGLNVNIDPGNPYLPASEVGIVDLEQSFFYYDTNNLMSGSKMSLAQILELSGPIMVNITEEYNPGSSFGPEFHPGYSNNDFSISWMINYNDPPNSFVPRITLAYNLAPVPEPETWAMLLTGLGIVGAVVRKRRTKESRFAQAS
jgi:hypothetical protein